MKSILTAISFYFIFVSYSLLAGNSTAVAITEQTVLEALISDSSVRQHAKAELLSIENVDIQPDYLSLHLRNGQGLLNKGTRSEISIDYPFIEKETMLYEWEMMLPINFKHDGPENRWWVMSQWHVQPDRTKAETWDDYLNKPPSIALYFGHINGHYYLSTEYMDVKTEVDNLIEIKLGQWIKLKTEITWSRDEDGQMKLWLNNNDIPHFSYSGANMLNGYQHFFKVGLYRHPEIATNNTIHLRALHVSKLDV